MTKKKATKKVKYSEEERHILILIKFTERAITNQGTDLDKFFQHQADRLKNQLKELRAK